MVARDPNHRNGKKHLGFWPSIVIMALAIIVALAPWLMPLMQYR